MRTLSGLLKQYWFLAGLLLVALITLGDPTGTVADVGRWLKVHRGPDGVIFAIFFFSGVALQTEQVRAGLSDIRATMAALGIIFVVSPLFAVFLARFPLDPGIRIGLFLVAAMPTTLSSGVVMTGAAGGNMANALMITLLANFGAIFTVPQVLTFLVGETAGASGALMDKTALMLKMGMLVGLPLLLGLGVRPRLAPALHRLGINPNVVNGCLVLGIVWIALSTSREMLLRGWRLFPPVVGLVVSFHVGLLIVAAFCSKILGLGRGRRESVLFMGSQKTLPLSVLLQTALFPQYGEALMFCVSHHVIHLLMDGYLVGRLSGRRHSDQRTGHGRSR